MATVAKSTNQQGITPIPGIAMVGIFTITPGTTATAGENLDFTDYFSTIDAITPAGTSNTTIAKYTPRFSFTPGGAVSATSVKFNVTLNDGGSAVDNGTDLSAVGTFQVVVMGKSA